MPDGEAIMTALIEVRDQLLAKPASRPNSLAITKVEEAMFWYNASLGDESVVGIFDHSPADLGEPV